MDELRYDEGVAATIQNACDDALRKKQFGATAIYVLRALQRDGWVVARNPRLSNA